MHLTMGFLPHQLTYLLVINLLRIPPPHSTRSSVSSSCSMPCKRDEAQRLRSGSSALPWKGKRSPRPFAAYSFAGAA